MKGSKNREPLITILEDLDFNWRQSEIDRAIRLWEYGTGLREMSRILKRSCEETFMLLIHLSMKNKIQKRKGYVWGGVQDSDCN
jgi:hypothetical protein